MPTTGLPLCTREERENKIGPDKRITKGRSPSFSSLATLQRLIYEIVAGAAAARHEATKLLHNATSHDKRPPKRIKKLFPGLKRKRWKSMSIAFSKTDLLGDIFYGRCNQRPIAITLDMVLCAKCNYIIAITEYKSKLFRFWAQYIIIIATYCLNCLWQNICSQVRVVHLKCRLFVLITRCSLISQTIPCSISHAIQATRELDVECGRHTRKTVLLLKMITFIYAYAYLIALSEPLCDMEPALCGDTSSLHFICRVLVTKIIMSGFGAIIVISVASFYLYRQLPSTVEEALARIHKIAIYVNGDRSTRQQVIKKKGSVVTKDQILTASCFSFF